MKPKLGLSIGDKETLQLLFSFLWVSCLISPFTANLIIMANFMNIRPLASSLGPFMCFTFDHLLCPAHKAEHSCSALTGEVIHGGCNTREAGGRTDSTGPGSLPEVGARVRGRRVRRALSTAAPAMPFTHKHTQPQCYWMQCYSNLLYMWSKDCVQEPSWKLPPAGEAVNFREQS